MDNVSRTLSLLKSSPEGLLIKDISNNLKISRNTVAVVVARLEGADKIRIRPIGKAKLIYINKV